MGKQCCSIINRLNAVIKSAPDFTMQIIESAKQSKKVIFKKGNETFNCDIVKIQNEPCICLEYSKSQCPNLKPLLENIQKYCEEKLYDDLVFSIQNLDEPIFSDEEVKRIDNLVDETEEVDKILNS